MMIKHTIGSVEPVRLHLFEGNNPYTSIIKARIDTGASISSINASSIREIKNELYFDLELNESKIKCTSNIYHKKMVKSSLGKQMRYVVPITLLIGGKNISSDFSLANRNHLRYPILIGRDCLSKNFIVDVAI